MGKRKSSKKPIARRKVFLDKQFTCHFCNHDESIECRLDREHSIGSLACRSCGVTWQTNIHNLTEPVDIYSDWIDACEEERERQRRVSNGAAGGRAIPSGGRGERVPYMPGPSTANSRAVEPKTQREPPAAAVVDTEKEREREEEPPRRFASKAPPRHAMKSMKSTSAYASKRDSDTEESEESDNVSDDESEESEIERLKPAPTPTQQPGRSQHGLKSRPRQYYEETIRKQEQQRDSDQDSSASEEVDEEDDEQRRKRRAVVDSDSD
eukprot:Partr_v1_DN23627_c0_g1_i1_m18921 putative elongation factor 1 homolog